MYGKALELRKNSSPRPNKMRLKKTTQQKLEAREAQCFLTNCVRQRSWMVSPLVSIARRGGTYISSHLQDPEETSMFGEPTVPVKGGAYVSWNAMAPGKQLAPPSMQFRDEYP